MARRTVTVFLVVMVRADLAICVALFVFQRSLIYFPQPKSWGGPATTLHIQTPEADLVLTTRPAAGPNAIL